MEQKRTKLVKRKAPQYKIKVRGEKVKKTSLFYQDKREAKQNAGVSGLSSAYDDDAEQYWSSSETSPAETYEQRRKQLSEDWRQMEENLFSLRIISFKPASFLCNICRQSTKNIVRCSDCGIPSYFCKPCWLTFHENIYYHVPDIWNEHKSVFIKMEVPVKTLRRLDAHECETSYVKQMVVIDNKGFQHSIDATFCQCEVEPVTLLRWNLWPGSAKSPKVAFSIDYLEFLRVLMLGKQVSTEGFVNCMHLRYVPVIGYKTKIKNIARILLNEVMESYRHHVYKLQNAQLPELVTAGIDNGTECPCCYLDEKKTFYLDGNFGLVRRQTGHNSIQPHHKDLYFLEQTAVDEFVQQYTQRFYPKQDCSDFQAGSTVRSKNKNKKLSVNGVFGACCKHEIPTLFMNMKHGERFSYPVFIIRQLLLKCSSPITIFYDIACRIFAHLRLKQDTDILPLVKFVVPVFHGYGHNVNCQAQFSPRKTLQCGLADGEGMERLWSFLRNFNKISKEMKTEHRDDLLTDGLLLYADKQKKKLGLVLVQKLEKARAIQKESKERLRHMINAHSSIESFDDVKATADTWQHIPSIQIDSSEQLDYHEEYAMKVNTLRIERAVLENLKSDDPQKAHQSGQIARLEHEALMLEQRLKIPHRWGNANPDFRTYTLSAVNKIRSKLQRKISKLNMEAKFVSSLLKKYPVGQAISGRILKTLKRINKNIKITMQEYNKYSDLPPSPLPQTSKIDQVTMPDDDSGGKQDMVDCYNMLLRSQEEETFTLQEMRSALAFYHRQIELCTGCMEKIPSPYTPYVHTQIYIKKTHLRELITKFKMYIDVPSVISHIVESSQDDWCSYDIESDYETDSSVDE